MVWNLWYLALCELRALTVLQKAPQMLQLWPADGKCLASKWLRTHFFFSCSKMLQIPHFHFLGLSDVTTKSIKPFSDPERCKVSKFAPISIYISNFMLTEQYFYGIEDYGGTTHANFCKLFGKLCKDIPEKENVGTQCGPSHTGDRCGWNYDKFHTPTCHKLTASNRSKALHFALK